MLLRGFLARGWFDALVEAGVSHPDRKMNRLQQMIWDDVFAPIWTQRNNILHGEANKYNTAEDEELTSKIIWYVQHKDRLLAGHDRFLARQDLTTLHRMRRETKREWIKHLETAKEAYEIERTQLASKQNVITRYYQKKIPSDAPT